MVHKRPILLVNRRAHEEENRTVDSEAAKAGSKWARQSILTRFPVLVNSGHPLVLP